MTRATRRYVTKKMRAEAVIRILMDVYDGMTVTLEARDTAWQLLVAAILAAQCTDERVNLITPDLFAAFPEMADMAAATPEAIQPYIRSCGLYRNKAKNIHGAARYLLEHEDGRVPDDEERLLKVPGVGRKIANLILGDHFGHQAIVVDTHCGRIAQLLGLTDKQHAPGIERDLERVVPKEHWTDWGHYMVEHGRRVCIARRPECARCPVAGACAHGRKTLGLTAWDLTRQGRPDETDGEDHAEPNASTEAKA